MAVAGLEPLENVTLTGFYDDAAIPTWCKGYVSSALKAGAIRGSTDPSGQPVFGAQDVVTLGEATVMLNSLLNISDVSAAACFSAGEGHWASQAAAHLAASGVMRPESAGTPDMSAQMTRAEAAELLDGALDVLAARDDGGWFPL